MPQGNGIRRSKDLRARFRKFLILTNERIQMSKMTLRKRIALSASAALVAGMLTTVASAPVANANASHPARGSANATAVLSGNNLNASLYVATAANSGGAGVVAVTANAIGSTNEDVARSVGLLSKDATSATAQTVTLLAGGRLSLYAPVSTEVAFTASAGTFASASHGAFSLATMIAYSDPAKTVSIASFQAATLVAALWTAPTTTGVYTVSLYRHSGAVSPTTATPAGGTLIGNITATVVAASAGGAYSAVYSACSTATTATAAAAADDVTSERANGTQWYINMALRDGYNQNLDSGAIVVSATNGALVAIQGNNSAIASAGVGSTAVLSGNGSAASVRIDQGTAGAPVSTTVTVTYNGTLVCSKTVAIKGVAAVIEIGSVGTTDLNTTQVNADWLSDPATAGSRAGLYTIILKDSANNIVLPAASTEFSMDPTTTTTTVTALSVNSIVATSGASSSSAWRYSVGLFTCGPVAGESSVKLRHTSAATGVTITSPAFTARCADDPYTYTASLDKASYVVGELATLTINLIDSKGIAANAVDPAGLHSINLPMLTSLTVSTGSATMIPNNKGVKTYTFTVGTPSGATAGTYTGVVDFTALTGRAISPDSVKTLTYKVTTGGDTTTNADVLKSIVALIASINKQIQALQKLILKR